MRACVRCVWVFCLSVFLSITWPFDAYVCTCQCTHTHPRSCTHVCLAHTRTHHLHTHTQTCYVCVCVYTHTHTHIAKHARWERDNDRCTVIRYARAQIGNAVAKVGYSDKAYPVDAAKSSTWAYYGAIFIVMVGSSMLLLYYMVPKGAIDRALTGDLGVYEKYSEEQPSRVHNPEDQNWNRGYSAEQAASVQMPERTTIVTVTPNVLAGLTPRESTLV